MQQERGLRKKRKPPTERGAVHAKNPHKDAQPQAAVTVISEEMESKNHLPEHSCFICGCGVALSEYYSKFKWQQNETEYWRRNCGTTLCVFLGSDYEQSSTIFANSAFCASCLGTIFEADDLLKTIEKFQMKLDSLRNLVQKQLIDHYKFSIASEASRHNILEQIVAANTIKTEVEDYLEPETDPLETFGIMLDESNTSDNLGPSRRRLRHLKARQNLDEPGPTISIEEPYWAEADGPLGTVSSQTSTLNGSSSEGKSKISAVSAGNQFRTVKSKHTKDYSRTKRNAIGVSLTQQGLAVAMRAKHTPDSAILPVVPTAGDIPPQTGVQLKVNVKCKCQGLKPPGNPTEDRNLGGDQTMKGMLFLCSQCPFRSSSQQSILRHFHQVHYDSQDPPQFTCTMYNKKFTFRPQAELQVPSVAKPTPDSVFPSAFPAGGDSESKNGTQAKACKCQTRIPSPKLADNLSGDDHEIEEMFLLCSRCPFRSNSQQLALRHTHQTHCDIQEPPEFTCTLCQKRFTFISQAKLKELSVVVDQVPKTHTVDESHLSTQQEQALESVLDPLKCDMCHAQYLTAEKLARHTDYHQYLNPLTCVFCQVRYVSKEKLILHVESHHKLDFRPKVFPCNFEECRAANVAVIGKKKMTEHLQEAHQSDINSQELVYHCTECTCRFRNLLSFREHSVEHQTHYACVVCGKPSESLRKLKKHQRKMHTVSLQRNEAPLYEPALATKCDVCNAIFDSAEAFRDHAALHQEEDQFNCVLCEDVHASKEELVYHVEFRHNLDKPPMLYPCNFFRCRNRLVVLPTRQKMVQHLTEVHQCDTKVSKKVKVHHCTECLRQFYKPHMIRGHMKKSHQKKTREFRCVVCTQHFASAFTLKRHQERLHTVTAESVEGLTRPTQTLKQLKVRESFKCDDCHAVYHSSEEVASHEALHRKHEPYKCVICLEAFVSKEDLVYHVEFFHNFGKRPIPFFCNYSECRSSLSVFSERALMLKHLKERHGGEGDHVELLTLIHHCVECDARFGLRSRLQDHVASRHAFAIPLFSCVVCAKQFYSERNMRKHQRFHSVSVQSQDNGDLLYCCETCGKRFRLSDDLRRHQEQHCGTVPVEECGEEGLRCVVCNQQFGDYKGMRSHQKCHTVKVEPKRCGRCLKKFQDDEGFLYHESLHTDDTPFDCVICPEKYHSTADLRRHVAAIHESRPFICHLEGCGISLESQTKLEAHNLRHVKSQLCEKCPYCSFQGLPNTSLKFHILRKHGTDKPFRCSIEGCSAKFALKSGQQSHLRYAHAIRIRQPLKLFPCPVCNKEFKTLSSLTVHEAFHRTGYHMMCELCSARFKSICTLRKHMESHRKWDQRGKEFKVLPKKTPKLVQIGEVPHE